MSRLLCWMVLNAAAECALLRSDRVFFGNALALEKALWELDKP